MDQPFELVPQTHAGVVVKGRPCALNLADQDAQPVVARGKLLPVQQSAQQRQERLDVLLG